MTSVRIMKIRDIIDPQLELGIGDIPSLSDKAFSSCVNIYDLVKESAWKRKNFFTIYHSRSDI